MTSPLALDALDAAIIAGLQGGFPLQDAPYEVAGQRWGLSGSQLQQRLAALLQRGVLTRFGPLYQIERMGGCFLLAALAVPEARYDAVAAQVNALPAVAHNYRREHALNMWFVLATTSQADLAEAMARIQADTGLPVYGFPKLREYYVGMQLLPGGDSAVGRQAATVTDTPPPVLDDADWRLIRATQAGLPLLDAPWVALEAGCQLAPGEACRRLATLLAGGVIRRIGVVPNHYALGYGANGMAVFDVDDAAVDALGTLLGAQPEVSHCYRRARQLPSWRYNLFAMCHGASHAQVTATVNRLRGLLGAACGDHQVLFSSRILKKTGLRV